jgi:hypothetical protein
MLRKIWSWEVVGAIVLFLLGGGVAFMTSGHAWIADIFFFAGSALFLIKFATWEETKTQSGVTRAAVIQSWSIITILVFIGAVAGNHYLNRPILQKPIGPLLTPTTPQPPSEAPPKPGISQPTTTRIPSAPPEKTTPKHEIAFIRITRHEIPLIIPDKTLYAKIYVYNNLDKSFTAISAYHSFVFRGLDPTADLAKMGSEVWEKDFIPNKLVWSRPTTITTADDQYGEIPIPPLPQEVVDAMNNKTATAAIVLMGIIRKQDDPSAKDVEFCIFFSDPEHIVACSRHN